MLSARGRVVLALGAFCWFAAVFFGSLSLYPVAAGLVLAVKPDAPAAFRRGAIDGRRSLVAAAAAVLLVVSARAATFQRSSAKIAKTRLRDMLESLNS